MSKLRARWASEQRHGRSADKPPCAGNFLPPLRIMADPADPADPATAAETFRHGCWQRNMTAPTVRSCACIAAIFWLPHRARVTSRAESFIQRSTCYDSWYGCDGWPSRAVRCLPVDWSRACRRTTACGRTGGVCSRAARPLSTSARLLTATAPADDAQGPSTRQMDRPSSSLVCCAQIHRVNNAPQAAPVWCVA